MIDLSSQEALQPSRSIACRTCGEPLDYMPFADITPDGNLVPWVKCERCVITSGVDESHVWQARLFTALANRLMWIDTPEAPLPTYVHTHVWLHDLPKGMKVSTCQSGEKPSLTAQMVGVVLREAAIPSDPNRLIISESNGLRVLWAFAEIRDTQEGGNPVVARQTANLGMGNVRLDLLNVEESTPRDRNDMIKATKALNAYVERRGRPKGAVTYREVTASEVLQAIRDEGPDQNSVIECLWPPDPSDDDAKIASQSTFRDRLERLFPGKTWLVIVRLATEK